MMPLSPSEHNEITGYIFHNYHHLLNSDEKDAFDIVITEGRSTANNAANKLLKSGEAEFYKKVVNRILNECKDEFVFNRCPKCNHLCRTPTAKQCKNTDCLYEWHNA